MAKHFMATTDSNSSMLGQWRIVLKQAEESARAGRFEEALELVARADVSDHRAAIQWRSKWAQELIARASRRAKSDDIAGAIADLAIAEKHQAPPDVMAAARLKIADSLVDEIHSLMESGEPSRAVDRIDELANAQIQSPKLRRLRETAAAWKGAADEMRRGEFGLARENLESAERLAAGVAAKSLAAARRELEARQATAAPKSERLYKALAAKNWTEILAAAEDLLECVPEHPAARQARSRAWQEIGAIRPATVLPARGRTEPQHPRITHAVADPGIAFIGTDDGIAARGAAPPRDRNGRAEPNGPAVSGRVLLWVDSVGGYLVCLDDRLVLGRAGPESRADIQLLGDLSRSHAVISRSGDGYLIHAKAPTFLNGKAVETAPLRDGDVIRLGASVELGFRLPCPASATARLELLSRHRLPLAVDGVILMAETCILGPGKQSHIVGPHLEAPIVLYRQDGRLWCRAQGAFQVDGRPRVSRAQLAMSSSVLAQDFSFSLEPVKGPEV
jgi:hypothetical protein